MASTSLSPAFPLLHMHTVVSVIIVPPNRPFALLRWAAGAEAAGRGTWPATHSTTSEYVVAPVKGATTRSQRAAGAADRCLVAALVFHPDVEHNPRAPDLDGLLFHDSPNREDVAVLDGADEVEVGLAGSGPLLAKEA